MTCLLSSFPSAFYGPVLSPGMTGQLSGVLQKMGKLAGCEVENGKFGWNAQFQTVL